MQGVAIESTNINMVGWEAGDLYIRFNKGAVYQYEGVPEGVYQGLLLSDSKGKFFHSAIRGAYEFHQLSEDVFCN